MANLFPKIGSSTTLSQEILKNIENAILQKKVAPGEKLPTESEMCQMFGVSRTALREALRMASARGLITIRKGSGIYVNEYSPDQATQPLALYLELNLDRDYILHVMEVRQMLEPSIARLAAINRTEQDLTQLEKLLINLERCAPNDYIKQGQIDRDFHLTIAQACRNPLIPVIVTPIFKLMPKIRSLVYKYVDTAKSEAIEWHRNIFDRIAAGDAEGAYQAMVKHLVIAERHTQKIID